MEIVDDVSRFGGGQLAIGISVQRAKVSVCGGGGRHGRAEHDYLEECPLMRGENDVVGEVDLLPFRPSLLLLLLLLSQADTVHLWEAKPTAVVGRKSETLLIRIPNHAIASLTHL